MVIVKIGKKRFDLEDIKDEEIPRFNIPTAKGFGPEQRAEIPSPPVDETTLAGRFAGAGVAPKQPGMSLRLSQEILGKYAAQEEAQAAIAAAMPTMSQADLAALQGQIGKTGTIPGEVPTLGESLKNVAPEIAAKMAAGAAAGAIGGAFVGGVGAIPGAAVGALVGAVQGIVSNLKEEEKQNTLVEYKGYLMAKANIKAIIDGVNQGLIDGTDAVDLFNRELGKINVAERNLKALSEREWLSKAKDELIQIESFNRYQRDSLKLQLAQAIMRPNPTKILTMPADLVIEQENA